MKMMTIRPVYLKGATIQSGTIADVKRFPFFSFIFVDGHYCGKIYTSVVKGAFV